MKEFENNAYFWTKIDTLYSSGDFKLLHSKGTIYNQAPNIAFPCDYGVVQTLENGKEIPMEVFKGTSSKKVDAVALCVNILTKKFEVKVLVGLSDEEIEEVLHFLNCTDFQKSVLIKRGKTIPSWGETE